MRYVKSHRILSLLVLVALVAAGLGWYFLRPTAPQGDPQQASSLRNALEGGDSSGFKRALEPIPFSFPADHGPHRDYQTEWWYYTGNLSSDDGRKWGYQLTFFRSGLSATPAAIDSSWATNEAYLAHFTISDIAGEQFHFEQLASRGGQIGLAGANDEPYHVFVEGWSASGDGANVMLHAATEQVSLSLQLAAIRPPTLQGKDGLSQKSAEAGNASYYYSYTRMQTSGMLSVGGQNVALEGSSWFDHEWSTSVLGAGQSGWDWFGLQLDDGRELMWWQLRRADGSIDRAQGSLTEALDVSAESLSRSPAISLQQSDLQVSVLDSWTSPESGAVYPAGWRLQIPSQGVDITLRPLLANQELRLNPTIYWEGAVAIEGSTTGRGYVELTGYGGASLTQ